MIEGEVSDDLPLLFKHNNMMIAKSKEEVRSSLEKLSLRKISIINKHGIEAPELLCMLRDLPDSQSLFIVNNDRNNSVDANIKLNGSNISDKPEGWFMDRAFDKRRLASIKTGINELILSCGYQNRMEVEDCYIIGEFGVDVNMNITKEPEIMHFGDWCLQGYLHYCGSMIYKFDFDYRNGCGEKAIIELGNYNAVTVEVRVNGAAAGHIPWRSANGIDITDF